VLVNTLVGVNTCGHWAGHTFHLWALGQLLALRCQLPADPVNTGLKQRPPAAAS
jgi:hypothetical protein